jgi:hypothetical protein
MHGKSVLSHGELQIALGDHLGVVIARYALRNSPHILPL